MRRVHWLVPGAFVAAIAIVASLAQAQQAPEPCPSKIERVRGESVSAVSTNGSGGTASINCSGCEVLIILGAGGSADLSSSSGQSANDPASTEVDVTVTNPDGSTTTTAYVYDGCWRKYRVSARGGIHEIQW